MTRTPVVPLGPETVADIRPVAGSTVTDNVEEFVDAGTLQTSSVGRVTLVVVLVTAPGMVTTATVTMPLVAASYPGTAGIEDRR